MPQQGERGSGPDMPMLSRQRLCCSLQYVVRQVLMHIVIICEAEAAALLAATQKVADQIKAALAATQPQAEDSEEEELDSSARPSRIDAVRAFFEEHHRKRTDAATANDNSSAADNAFEPGNSKPFCLHTQWTSTKSEESEKTPYRMRHQVSVNIVLSVGCQMWICVSKSVLWVQRLP